MPKSNYLEIIDDIIFPYIMFCTQSGTEKISYTVDFDEIVWC